MTKRIFRSIMAVAGTVLLVSAVLFIGFLYSHFGSLQAQQLRQTLSFAVQGVELQGLDYLTALDGQEYRLTWVSPAGDVRYDTKASTQDMDNHADRAEIQEALSIGMGSEVRYSSTLLEQTMYCARRLSDGSVLRISISRATVWLLALGMFQPILLVLLLALILAAVLASKTARRIVEPLDHLDLDAPLENNVYDELAPLVRRIDEQNQHIQRQMEELERRHQETEQMRREFTANVSHELKTPLQTISGSAEIILGGLVPPDDQPQFIQRIYQEAHRLITLVEDILRLSKLDEGVGLRLEPVDLNQLAQEIVERLEPAARQDWITLKVTGEGGVLTTDRRLVDEVLSNLVDNAIKYNKPGGSVTITLLPNGFTVTDTGIGIPPQHQERVFERFYRVDPSRSKTIGGTGLGLSIVKHSVAVLGGQVSLSSTPGAGTTLTVSLPSPAPKPKT